VAARPVSMVMGIAAIEIALAVADVANISMMMRRR
jgi:hypothetical protein